MMPSSRGYVVPKAFMGELTDVPGACQNVSPSNGAYPACFGERMGRIFSPPLVGERGLSPGALDSFFSIGCWCFCSSHPGQGDTDKGPAVGVEPISPGDLKLPQVQTTPHPPEVSPAGIPLSSGAQPSGLCHHRPTPPLLRPVLHPCRDLDHAVSRMPEPDSATPVTCSGPTLEETFHPHGGEGHAIRR